MIEACVRSRETISVRSMSPNMERKRTQAIDWSPIAASRELKELFLFDLAQILGYDLPEPFDHLIVF
jgi:hypothetical protein